MALRNLLRQWRRYILVALAVTVGFAMVTVITGIAYGALETIKDKAARYFSGHVSVTGYLPEERWGIPEPEAVRNALLNADIPLRTVSFRATYDKNDAVLFFGGESVRQRKLIGVDFSVEGKEFQGLSFSSGGLEGMADSEGKDGILVSETASRLLGCRVGDDLTLYLTTDTGQYNTATLIVRGIFTETSLFGYAAYMRMADLNRLRNRPEAGTTDIAVYTADGADITELAERVRLILTAHFAVFPALKSREARDAELAKGIEVPTLAVLSLDAQLAQITQLLDALLAVTYFTLALFLTIVMVGVLNTYRVLVHERTREIGALRALGMQRRDVVNLFLAEAAGLALLSSAAGFCLGLLILRVLSMLDLSSLPAAGMFLSAGRLRSRLDAAVALFNSLLMIAAVLFAAWGPARRAGNIRPVDAMRSV